MAPECSRHCRRAQLGDPGARGAVLFVATKRHRDFRGDRRSRQFPVAHAGQGDAGQHRLRHDGAAGPQRHLRQHRQQAARARQRPAAQSRRAAPFPAFPIPVPARSRAVAPAPAAPPRRCHRPARCVRARPARNGRAAAPRCPALRVAYRRPHESKIEFALFQHGGQQLHRHFARLQGHARVRGAKAGKRPLQHARIDGRAHIADLQPPSSPRPARRATSCACASCSSARCASATNSAPALVIATARLLR